MKHFRMVPLALIIWSLVHLGNALHDQRFYKVPQMWAKSCSAFDIQIALWASGGRLVGVPKGVCFWAPNETVTLWSGMHIQGVPPVEAYETTTIVDGAFFHIQTSNEMTSLSNFAFVANRDVQGFLFTAR